MLSGLNRRILFSVFGIDASFIFQRMESAREFFFRKPPRLAALKGKVRRQLSPENARYSPVELSSSM
jgi:hypothetical protein